MHAGLSAEVTGPVAPLCWLGPINGHLMFTRVVYGFTPAIKNALYTLLHIYVDVFCIFYNIFLGTYSSKPAHIALFGLCHNFRAKDEKTKLSVLLYRLSVLMVHRQQFYGKTFWIYFIVKKKPGLSNFDNH